MDPHFQSSRLIFVTNFVLANYEMPIVQLPDLFADDDLTGSSHSNLRISEKFENRTPASTKRVDKTKFPKMFFENLKKVHT